MVALNRRLGLVIVFAALLIFLFVPVTTQNICPGHMLCPNAPYQMSLSFYLFNFGGFITNFGHYGFAVPGLGWVVLT